MKRIVLVVVLVLMSVSFSFGAHDNTAVCTPSSVDKYIEIHSCAFVDSVAAGITEEWKIISDAPTGRLIGWRWEAASEDLDWWLSEEVDSLATDTSETILHITGINLGEGEILPAPLPYISDGGFIYVTVKNDGAIATGTSAILILIYERI